MRCKKTELNKFLYEVQPDIVLLQETWFSDKKSPHFNGYVMVKKNRSATYKTIGGGGGQYSSGSQPGLNSRR